MFKKIKLKRQIKQCKRIISSVEHKRIRSQSALVQSILTKSTPSDEDVDYFNQYTKEIEEIRNRMEELILQLERIQGKTETE